MTDDTILKQVLKNLGQIGTETVEKGVENVGKITESIITGKELLGELKTLTPEEESKKKTEDQKKISDIRSQISGRNLDQEIKQIDDQKRQEKESAEEKMLREVREKREAEDRERQQLEAQMGVSSNPHKQKKKRGSAFATGKKKTNQPDPMAMSQTAEKGSKME